MFLFLMSRLCWFWKHFSRWSRDKEHFSDLWFSVIPSWSAVKPSEASGLVSPVKRWKDSVVVWHIQVRLSGAVKWSNRCFQSFSKMPTMHCATGVCQWCNWVVSAGRNELKSIQQRTQKGFQREGLKSILILTHLESIYFLRCFI